MLDLQDQFPGVRLVSRGDVSLGRPYATLSYCWGGVDFLKLKQSNSAELEAHISLGSLPMTFVQAIEVARRLSIPYLWIDSLCIVQDSTEDLQRELASMREVFGNSILNIMATASSNGFEGLFRARDPRALEILKITTTWDDEKSQEFVVVERNVWEEQLAEAPLIDRGWVVQERILPPRAVHFGQSQLFWECRELDACETHPNGLPWGLQDDLSKIKTLEPGIWHDFCQQKYLDEDKHNLDYRSPPCPQPYSGYDLWARIVQYYTRTKLSYASDKLIAIGGLAERMEYALGDTYLMGLWVQFLPSQLLWTVKDYQLSTRPSKYRAPSWSWFSMDGVISTTIPENGLRNLISVVDRPIVPSSGSDVADQASTNKIKLNGMIIPGQIAESSPGSDSYSLTLDGFGGLQGRSILSLDVQFSPESLQSVMCLPMDMQEETTCTQRIRTLILRKAEGRPKGWYERIGVVNNERGFGIRGSSDMGNKAADEEWPLLQAMKSHIIVGTDLYLDGEPGSLVIM